MGESLFEKYYLYVQSTLEYNRLGDAGVDELGVAVFTDTALVNNILPAVVCCLFVTFIVRPRYN